MSGFTLDPDAVAQLVILVGAISAAVIAIIRELRASRAATTAAAVVTAAQQNRYLVTRGAEPVTMASPPSTTGSGGLDKAVEAILTEAAPVPAAGGASYADLLRRLESLERMSGQ